MTMIKSFTDYQEQYNKSVENPEAFWAEIAEDFTWKKKWDKVLEWDFHKPEVKWFIGGETKNSAKHIDRGIPTTTPQNAPHWGAQQSRGEEPPPYFKWVPDPGSRGGKKFESHAA